MSWFGGGAKPVQPLVVKGAIVYAYITPDKGPKKRRRSVVLGVIDPETAIYVVGVTSDGGEYVPSDPVKYPPDLFVSMPHAPDGSSPTTFTMPCAAKLNWTEKFRRDELETTSGYLPSAEFDKLYAATMKFIEKEQAEIKARETKPKS